MLIFLLARSTLHSQITSIVDHVPISVSYLPLGWSYRFSSMSSSFSSDSHLEAVQLGPCAYLWNALLLASWIITGSSSASATYERLVGRQCKSCISAMLNNSQYLCHSHLNQQLPLPFSHHLRTLHTCPMMNHPHSKNWQLRLAR